jgi:hypothetical protein
VTGEKIVDEVANDGIGFIAKFGDHPTYERAAASVPFEIDRAMKIARAVNFRPAVGTPRLFGPDLDKIVFLLQLRIAHDFRPERAASGRDDLNQRLHVSLGSLTTACLQRLFSVAVALCATRHKMCIEKVSVARRRAARLQILKHHVGVNETFLRMAKRSRQGSHNLEAEVLPQT